MIKLQLGNIFLDTYSKEQVELSWDGFRFQKNLRAGYTNDLMIPKTVNNLSALQAVGLLDSTAQMFGSKTVKGILQVELRVLPVFIQVCSVTKEEIGICIYEDTFPYTVKDKTIRDVAKDDDSSIWQWNVSTLNHYTAQDGFVPYNYGMPHISTFAEYHPVKPVNDLIAKINSELGFNFGQVNTKWMLMATLKKVTPQNKKQVIRGKMGEDGDFAFVGGQHVTNDLEFIHGEGMTEIEFNRDCVLAYDGYLSWYSKATMGNSSLFTITIVRANGQIETNSVTIQSNLYRNDIVVFSNSINLNAGDKLKFHSNNADKYNMVQFVLDCTITQYDITDDDYSTELNYEAQLPILETYDYNTDNVTAIHFADLSKTIKCKYKNSNTYFYRTIAAPYLSYSYFGFWTNVPDAKLSELFYSLQWHYGMKLSFDHNHTISWVSPYEQATVQGNITEIRPISDKLGQRNVFKYAETDEVDLVSEIDNEWLAEEVTLIESKFYMPSSNDADTVVLDQYSNPTHDGDSSVYSVDFNEIEAITILEMASGELFNIKMHTLGLEWLTQSYEVDITTYTPQLRDKDIVYLDGRKYFVVTCKTNIDTQKSELTCLLVPNNIQQIKP